MRRPRWAWKHWDDEELRRLHAQGLSDVQIAKLMDRTHQIICIHRNKMGLVPQGKPGSPTGWKHTAAARAKVSEANRKRWQDPETRAKLLPNLKNGPAAARRKQFRPSKGTPEFKQYRKIAEALGPTLARVLLKLTTT